MRSFVCSLRSFASRRSLFGRARLLVDQDRSTRLDDDQPVAAALLASHSLDRVASFDCVGRDLRMTDALWTDLTVEEHTHTEQCGRKEDRRPSARRRRVITRCRCVGV